MWNETHKSEMAASDEIPFLGTGWSFPPEFEHTTGGVVLTSGDLDIKNSLTLLLSTIPGERKVAPLYGVDLSVLLFENLTISLKTRVTDMISRAILRFEPRIDLEEIIYTDAPLEGKLFINVHYTIRTTNTRTNLVFPFYRMEGTDL